MANKKLWLGILVMVLVFGLGVVGCETNGDDGGGYTFEFKVENQGGIGTIKKIEFINGSNKNEPVLQTEITDLSSWEMTGVYKVSGFTEKDKDNYRFYGIQVTTSSDRTYFKYSSATNNSKIRVLCHGGGISSFPDGNW